MKTKQGNINYYKTQNVLKDFFKCYNKIIIILCFISLLAILTGVLTAAKYSGSIEIDNLSNSTLINFLKRETGVWPLFFKYLLNFLIICGIAIFLNIKPFCITFNIIVLCVYCYLNAFDITVIIISFSLSGILNAIFILIPFFLIILYIYLIISAIAIKNNILRNKFGKSCEYFLCSPLKIYTFLILIVVILYMIQCNIMPIIHATIIID